MNLLYLFISLVLGALVAIAAVLVVVIICFGVYYLFMAFCYLIAWAFMEIQDAWYGRKKTAGRKQYKKQGGPW